MSSPLKAKPVILIVGPTAAGKTSFSIALAQEVNGELISADSRYLYRGMNIGTAKPTEEELSKAPHHMINIAEPNETISLPQYLEKTFRIVEEIHARGRIPIIVGGTGQYTRALTEGWRIPALRPNETLRKQLNEWGTEIGAAALHQKLAIIDPQAANMIDASNLRRTIRALEVTLSTGCRFSELRISEGPAYCYHIIGLTMERTRLYERVDGRIETMFTQGLVDEVRTLINQGYTAELPAMSAIGYREVMQYLAGEIDLGGAMALMRKNTRRLIRRQANWFKPTDPSIHWYEMSSEMLNQVLSDLTECGIYGEKDE